MDRCVVVKVHHKSGAGKKKKKKVEQEALKGWIYHSGQLHPRIFLSKESLRFILLMCCFKIYLFLYLFGSAVCFISPQPSSTLPASWLAYSWTAVCRYSSNSSLRRCTLSLKASPVVSSPSWGTWLLDFYSSSSPFTQQVRPKGWDYL